MRLRRILMPKVILLAIQTILGPNHLDEIE